MSIVWVANDVSCRKKYDILSAIIILLNVLRPVHKVTEDLVLR